MKRFVEFSPVILLFAFLAGAVREFGLSEVIYILVVGAIGLFEIVVSLIFVALLIKIAVVTAKS